MIINPTLRSQEITAQQVRNARRVAILLLVAVVPSIGLLGFLAYQSGAWQLAVETGIMTVYGIVLVLSFRLIRRNRVLLGMQILLIGMGLGLLALNLLIEGLGILLGVAVSLLITAVATLTLPERMATPAVIISFGLGLFIVLLDALLPAYRLLVPALNVYVPGAVVVLSAVCIYLIARQFGSYSMRGKLTLTLLLVAILPIVLQAVAYSLLAEGRLTTTAQQALKAAAEQTAKRVDRFINDGLLDIQSGSKLPDVVDYLSAPVDQRDFRKLAAILDALSARNRFIRSYAVFNTLGTTLFDTNRQYIGTNQFQQIFFQQPLSTGASYVSPVLFDPLTGEGLVHFSAPVRNGRGELIGIARVAYSISALQDLVAQAADLGGAGSFGILLDENHFRLADGTALGQSKFRAVVQPSAELLASLRAAKRVPEVEDTALWTNMPDFEAGLEQASVQPFFVAEFDQTTADAIGKQTAEQIAVATLAERPWLMVFGQPQQAFLSSLNDLARSSLFLVLAISAVTLLVAARVSRMLAQPILRLNETAGRVAQGDLSARATIETADEIGTLAATFNSMTEQLGSMVTTLEDRVQARTAQLRASAEVGHAATSILNPDQLLKQVVDLITTRFGFYYTAVFVVDEDNQRAVLHAATGEAGHFLLERGHRLPLNGESMVGAAITTSLPKIALDVGQGAVRFANPLLPNTRSEIALPLRVGERVIGALDVQSEKAGVFDEASAEVLQAMADQVAVALFNAETFNRSEKQAHALAQLNQLSRELAQVTTRESVAFAVAQTVTELIGTNRLTLVETTPDPQLLSARTLWLDANRPLGEVGLMPRAGTLTDEASRTGKTIYAPQLADYTTRHSDAAALAGEGLQTLVAIPMQVSDRPMGTLVIGSEQSDAYLPAQLSQLEQVAAQMAVALDNLGLAERTRQALSELDAANRRLTGEAWMKYTQGAGGVVGEWREGTWLRLNDSQRSVSSSLADQALSLPIRVRGETIGEFSVAAGREAHDWTPDDRAFAQALIDQVGQVIENARLLEETERFAQREQRIREITTRIRTANDVQAVLQTTTTELARSLGVSRAIMRLTLGDQPVAGKPGRLPQTVDEGDNHVE